MSGQLLRPNQIAEYEHTEKSLERKLKNKYIEDKAAVRGQLRRLRSNLEKQRPIEPIGEEKDAMVKETDTLLEEIKIGMPSQEEMRKCPPGAIDKHRIWERRNKAKIQQWKNNQLRLNAGSDAVDIANLEVYRPTKNSLNMDNAFIKGEDYHLPEKIGYCMPFSDDDIRLLRARAPQEIWSKLPTMTAEQRTITRQIYITTWDEPEAQVEVVKPEVPEVSAVETPEDMQALDLEDEEDEDIEMLADPDEEKEMSTTEALTESLSDISGLWDEEEPAPPTNANRGNRRGKK
jgi:hypothetical protein